MTVEVFDTCAGISRIKILLDYIKPVNGSDEVADMCVASDQYYEEAIKSGTDMV